MVNDAWTWKRKKTYINNLFIDFTLTLIIIIYGRSKFKFYIIFPFSLFSSATGVTGTIRVNGKVVSTNSQKYRELSCYIHQDDLLRPQLTVGEIMMLAAHLKLGFKISKSKKLTLVKHILSLLGLEHRFNVFTAKLSGGQKKRLAIALELISNPPVLYLDEPTTWVKKINIDYTTCTKKYNISL